MLRNSLRISGMPRNALFLELIKALLAIVVIANPGDECRGETEEVRGNGGVGRIADSEDLSHFLIRHFIAEAYTKLPRAVINEFCRVF